MSERISVCNIIPIVLDLHNDCCAFGTNQTGSAGRVFRSPGFPSENETDVFVQGHPAIRKHRDSEKHLFRSSDRFRCRTGFPGSICLGSP